MKKNIFRVTGMLLTAILISASLSGCNSNSNQSSTNQEAETKVELPEDVKTMLEPADAILMTMTEGNVKYDPSDEDFFWHSLYIFTGIYAQEHSIGETTDNTLTIPRQSVQEFAIALFSDYDDLPEIPTYYFQSMLYNSSKDAYVFSRGDRGLSEPVATGFEDNGDGTYTLDVKLISPEDGKTINSGRFTIVPNEYTDFIAEPIYNYSISAVEPIK